jgi:hypothetical protein
MTQLDGFVKKMWAKLLNAKKFYQLKQAPKAKYTKINAYFKYQGLCKTNVDYNIYFLNGK